jgi:hypothetical protein
MCAHTHARLLSLAPAVLAVRTRRQNHKLVVVEGADHTFSNDDAFFKAAAAVLPFIHSSVGADGGVKRGLMWR